MGSVKTFFTEFVKQASWDSLFELVRNSVSWPYIVAAIAWLWTVIDGFPLSMAFLATLAAFAFMATSLAQYSTYKFNNDPQYKIDYVGPFVHKDVDESEPSKVTGFRLGFLLQNSAQFPIDIYVKSVSTKFGKYVNPSPSLEKRDFSIGPGAQLYVDDDMIDLSDVDLKDSTHVASVSFEISYGKTGKLKHSFSRSFTFPIRVDKEGGAVAGRPSDTYTSYN